MSTLVPKRNNIPADPLRGKEQRNLIRGEKKSAKKDYNQSVLGFNHELLLDLTDPGMSSRGRECWLWRRKKSFHRFQFSDKKERVGGEKERIHSIPLCQTIVRAYEYYVHPFGIRVQTIRGWLTFTRPKHDSYLLAIVCFLTLWFLGFLIDSHLLSFFSWSIFRWQILQSSRVSSKWVMHTLVRERSRLKILRISRMSFQSLPVPTPFVPLSHTLKPNVTSISRRLELIIKPSCESSSFIMTLGLNNFQHDRRKSISGNWKANVGSAMLEQMPVADKHKKWLDEVSEIFGGLEILTVEAILAKDGREIIYEVTGSQMTLMGETQEEDRRLISDLVCLRMGSVTYRPTITWVATFCIIIPLFKLDSVQLILLKFHRIPTSSFLVMTNLSFLLAKVFCHVTNRSYNRI